MRSAVLRACPLSKPRPGCREMPACRRGSGWHTSPLTDSPSLSFSGSRGAGHETTALSEGPPSVEAYPWAAVACALRTTIPHSQAPAKRTKTEVSTASLRPVWFARPSTVLRAKHGAMKPR